MGIYKADQEIYDEIQDLIAKYHGDLVLVEDEIAVIFRDKASKSGGKVILGKSKKAPPLLGVLGDREYKFIIELAADEWMELDGKQRTALLDHHLCSCCVEEDAEKGTMNCFITPPDVAFFYEELDRHGDWRPRPEGEGPSPLLEMLRKEDDGNKAPSAASAAPEADDGDE